MRRLYFVLSLLVTSLFLPIAAHAQLSSSNPPPQVILSDENDVDLKTGSFVDQSKALGVGEVEDPAISYTPIDVNYSNNAGTPLAGVIQHYTCGLSDDDCTEYLVARLGNKTLTFHREPGEMNLTAFSGERLVSDPVLGTVIYDNDDTAWFFSGAFAGGGNESQVYETGHLTKIVYRDGRALTYVRAPNTDVSVTSNQGYQLVIRAGQTDVKMINTAIDYCDVLASSCAYTQNWPTFTRAGSSSGGIGTFTLNDPISRTTTIVVTPVFGASGGSDTDIYRPGGLHQFIRQRTVVLYSQNDKFASAMVVTNYSDDFGSTSYSYSSSLAQLGTITHSVATKSTGSQITFNLLYDEHSITDELGHTTTYSFNSGMWGSQRVPTQLIRVRAPELAMLEYSYDGLSNIIQSTATPKPGSGQNPVSSTSTFAAGCMNGRNCHLPEYTLDANQKRTDFSYDSQSGMMLSKTLPADANGVRPQIRFTWQPLQAVYKQTPTGTPQASGLPVWRLVGTSTCRTMAGAACVGTVDEIRTTVTYNGNLLPISETVQSGDGSLVATTTRDYDVVGNIIWTDGPTPGAADRTYFFWDAARQPIGEIGPDPDGTGPLPRPAVRRQFSPHGLVSQEERGSVTAPTLAGLNAMTVNVTISNIYDTRGRMLSEQVVGGGGERTLVQYSYGYKGLPECTAIRMNPAVYGGLPASACTLGTEGNQGPDRITRNIYDTAGRLTQIRMGVGTPLEQNYASYTYSADGKVTSMTDANNNKASMTYDGFDREVRWNFPSPTTPGQDSATDYEAYTYDPRGNRLTRRKRDGQVIGYTYDDLGRMVVKDIPGSTSADVYYGYDLQGQLIYARFVSASGTGIINNYGALGRLTDTTNDMGVPTRTLTYGWDVSGNRTRITYPDSTYFTYEYDDLDRPTAIKENGSVVIVADAYDPQGRRSSEVRGGVTTTYTYDSLSRLTSQTHDLSGSAYDVTAGFSYNPASQIISRSRTNDGYAFRDYANQSGVYVDLTRAYSANGLNQYTAAGTASFTYDPNGNLTGDGTSTYTYDVENRLVTKAGGGVAATLQYDPLGRLWRIVLTGKTIEFVHDGDAVVVEYNGSVMHRYVHGDGFDDPLIWYLGPSLSDRRSLQADSQGSIISVADANGTATNINSYDEYGIPGATNFGRFMYTGQMWIGQLGMYYYKARIYSPTLGRFLQVDPIAYDDQVNLYAYVRNDPIDGRDPTGLQDHFDMQMRHDDEALISGRMTEREYRERQRARGIGGLVGGTVVVTVVVAPEVLPFALRSGPVLTREGAKRALTAAAERAGITINRAGDIIGWGRNVVGTTAVNAARARTAQITRATVRAMRDSGLTKDLAIAFRDQYRSAIARGAGGQVARERLRLMEKILKLWPRD